VLGDWDGACYGPREIDLIPVGAPGNRFGDHETERAQFVTGYGYDIATWPEYTILRDIRDLHSIAAYIRTAPYKPAAAHELQRRLRSLQRGDRTIQWKAVQ
jgi:hypothetical protein